MTATVKGVKGSYGWLKIVRVVMDGQRVLRAVVKDDQGWSICQGDQGGYRWLGTDMRYYADAADTSA